MQVNLAQRKVPNNRLCPVCSSSNETTVHALWGCKDLKKVRSKEEGIGIIVCCPLASVVYEKSYGSWEWALGCGSCGTLDGGVSD
ncbi:hypothetical protein Q3G72_015297 [Acer saccharum]|nr:hypothetical protein Q3G72_015297 [Acer saccharum]